MAAAGRGKGGGRGGILGEVQASHQFLHLLRVYSPNQPRGLPPGGGSAPHGHVFPRPSTPLVRPS